MEHSQHQNFQFRLLKTEDSLNNELNKIEGRWDQDQHQKFVQAIIRYGKDWKKVETYVSTRTGSQVRSHAQKYFIKIIKIMKDRKKLKGRKIPDITETQRELTQYFKQNKITQNTPKEICDLLKLRPFSKQKIEDKQQNSHQNQNIKEYNPVNKHLNQKQQKRKIIQSIELQCGQDQSIFSSIMRRNFDYFVKGGDFSGLIDFGMSQKKYIQEEETSTRKFSFMQFDENENQKLHQ